MTTGDPDRIRRDLAADVKPEEAAALTAVAARLERDRPLPAPGFRGDLHRRLETVRASAVAPRQIRALALSSALSGLVLLAVAAVGVAGSGPFAA